MAKLLRTTQQPFGSTGNVGDFGKFGSWQDGTKVNTKDLTVIQSMAAFLTGWAGAVKGDMIPTLEEFNSLFYLIFHQIGYLLQTGVGEWDSGTTYYTNSIVQVSGVLYKSLQDTNLNKDPTTEAAWWVLLVDLSNFVDLTNPQTVNGVKTFGSFPVTPSSAPTTNYQAANKKYVDDQFALTPKIKVGSFTRDVSVASGTQAVTGVGFRPKGIIFSSGGLATGMDSQASVDGYDDAVAAGCLWWDFNSVDNEWKQDTSNSIHYEKSGAGQTGKIATFDADGFTVNWTKVGSQTGTITIRYIAIG